MAYELNLTKPIARQGQSTLKIELKTVEDGEGAYYISGNFNNWQAGDSRYRLQFMAPGKYQVFLPTSQLQGVIAYKFNRGSWDTVELYANGANRGNRYATAASGVVKDFVPRWRKVSLMYNESFLPKKHIISESFEIPQLIKTRRITALLPYDYDHSEKRYPVLYLQDGQNLFDDYAPFGNWGIDKKLAQLVEAGMGEIIIVAIDHAEEERIEEFTPSHPTKLGRGEGKKYVRFLADTLKPYIDKHFRTLPEKEYTGIGGSSMGGLISIYAALMYPEVYSRILLFSPSLWVDPNIYFNLPRFIDAEKAKWYLYGGGQEGSGMVKHLEWLKDILQQQGQIEGKDFLLAIDPEGQHNEYRWGLEFPKAVEWLFFNNQ